MTINYMAFLTMAVKIINFFIIVGNMYEIFLKLTRFYGI